MSRATRTRPVFLNLAQIHMPVGAWTSIGHRVSGIVLAVSVPIGIVLLDHSLQDEQGFVQVTGLLGHGAAEAALVLVVWALAHHLMAGIRHLLSDFDVGSPLRLAPSQCLVRQPRRRGGGAVRSGGVVVRLAFSGLAAWQVQRVSAVCMLLFVMFALVAFSIHPRPSYLAQPAWVSSPGVSIAMLALIAALLSHMWVGLRDVLLDYAKPAWLCRLLLGLAAAGLVSSGAWVLLVFGRVQT